METLFELSINKYSLFFLSKKVESKYRKNLNEIGGFQDKLAFFFVFVSSIVGLLFAIISLYLSTTPENKRYVFEVQLAFVIILCIAIMLEIIFYCLESLSYFRGVCFILIPILIGAETTARYTANFNGLSPNLISYVIMSIYIGISINKIWYISSFSISLGIIYFIIRFMQNSQYNMFQIFQFLSAILLVLLYSILIFYYNETILRKNFFSFLMLKKKERQVKNVLKEVPVSIFVKKGCKILFLNKCLKRLLGITLLEDKDIKALCKEEKEIRYREYISKIKTEDGNSLINLIEKFNDNLIQRKSFFLNQNGQNLEFKVKGVKFAMKKKQRYVYVLEEVSQTLRVQKEIEKKYQKILIASVTHDLLTPVNGSLGLLDVLLTKQIGTKIKNKLIIIKNLITKLTYYVQLFKLYSLHEGNSLSNYQAEINCIEIIKNCAELFKRDMKKKGIKFELKLEIPKLILLSDQTLFSQIIFTLIQNAEKHTFQGLVTIECKIENKDFFLIVEDTGEGMREETLQNVFILYSSSWKSNELNPQGIGLSLFVCKKLAQILGGNLICHSTFNKGTQFIFSIPNCIVDKNIYEEFPDNIRDELPQEIEHSLHEIPIKNEESSSSRKFIIQNIESPCHCIKYLIVDDDLTNIKVLKSFFKSIQKEVDSAFNGVQALELVKQNNAKKCCLGYILIIMDINMPIMDGEEATRIIKRMANNNEISMPIIVGLTAAQILDQKHKNDFLKAGFNDMINKPLSRKGFLNLLKTYELI